MKRAKIYSRTVRDKTEMEGDKSMLFTTHFYKQCSDIALYTRLVILFHIHVSFITYLVTTHMQSKNNSIVLYKVFYVCI